eukprot:607288-Pyramimonas_sp.AAC.1
MQRVQRAPVTACSNKIAQLGEDEPMLKEGHDGRARKLRSAKMQGWCHAGTRGPLQCSSCGRVSPWRAPSAMRKVCANTISSHVAIAGGSRQNGVTCEKVAMPRA